MSTVILQTFNFKNKHNPEYDEDYDFLIRMCMSTVRDYADLHGYDYVFKGTGEFHETSRKWDPNSTCNNYFHEWIYWLKDLYEKYDNIIFLDSDIYVIDDSQPFPIEEPGLVSIAYEYDYSDDYSITLNGIDFKEHSKNIYDDTDWRRHKCPFLNLGTVKLDSKTAKDLYEWTIKNRKNPDNVVVDGGFHHVSDSVTVAEFIIGNPEVWNPCLDIRWNYTYFKNKIQNPLFLHPLLNDEETSKLKVLNKMIDDVYNQKAAS